MEEIGKILPRVLDRRAAKNDCALWEWLAPLWERVAGAAIAAQSRPEGFSAGTLTLAVSSAAWAVTLRQMSEELRAAINGYLGKAAVRKLRVVLVAGTAPGESGTRRPASCEVGNETVRRLERTLARRSAVPRY